MAIRQFEGNFPKIAEDVFIDNTALVIGDISIARNSSIWPGTILRGDVNTIRIGKNTNIQDNSVVHVTHDSIYHPEGFTTNIGDDVTVGHRAILHGCTVLDRCLIGMGAIIMDGALIESNVILAAGSLVPPGKTVAGGYLWVGSPAKKSRKLTEKEIEEISYSANFYAQLKKRHQMSLGEV